jgi:uncharacterized membrane protein YfcA
MASAAHISAGPPPILVFALGGLVGSYAGALAARKLSGTTGLLTTVFAVLIFLVAAYMLWKSAGAFLGITVSG